MWKADISRVLFIFTPVFCIFIFLNRLTNTEKMHIQDRLSVSRLSRLCPCYAFMPHHQLTQTEEVVKRPPPPTSVCEY